ncbi:hypothetical protein [Dactylosporangium sp. NPDC049140]|uniref:hypothetical protein n=1 Tax=Dactylosporangium sp. NPDC049140 TaxID=3155647 RepID=UPI0033FA23F8
MTEPPGSAEDGLSGVPDGFPAPPAEGLSRRGVVLLAGGGIAVVLAVGIALVALATGDGPRPRPPAAVHDTPQPVVPEDSVTLGPPATAQRTTVSERPSATRSSARPTSAAPTTPSGPRVVTVSVSADPGSFTACRGTLVTKITVRMTLSQPGLPVRYTINESTTVRRTASGTSFSETTQATVGRTDGVHQVRIAVTEPSTASATTTIEVDCGK